MAHLNHGRKPLAPTTRLKAEGSEEVAAALRRDLDEMNSVLEEGRN
jgi:hypothetical protein